MLFLFASLIGREPICGQFCNQFVGSVFALRIRLNVDFCCYHHSFFIVRLDNKIRVFRHFEAFEHVAFAFVQKCLTYRPDCWCHDCLRLRRMRPTTATPCLGRCSDSGPTVRPPLCDLADECNRKCCCLSFRPANEIPTKQIIKFIFFENVTHKNNQKTTKS